MFAVNGIHETKSKSTQLLCKEPVLACLPSKDVGTMGLAKLKLSNSADGGMDARIDSRKSSNTTLAEHLQDHKLDFSASHERFSSIDSALLFVHLQLKDFNDSLAKYSDANVFVVESPEMLKRLLDMHYSGDNPMPPSGEMFPYLHGALSIREKVYFDHRFNPATDLNFLSEDIDTISHRFPSGSFAKAPELGFHLITVNSQGDESPCLVNSVMIEDLLAFRPSHDSKLDGEEFDYASLLQFHEFSQETEPHRNPLAHTNRNFRLQVQLMCPISDFLVYNNGMHLSSNTDVARIIEYLKGTNSTKNVYVVDFPALAWDKVGRYHMQPPQAQRLAKEHKAGRTDHHARLCYLEQNLMWQVYSLTQLFPRLYVGNVFNFKRIVASEEKSSSYDFKLYIYCHENARMPAPASLQQTLHDIETRGLDRPIFLEFSDAIFKQGLPVAPENMVGFLNMIRILNRIVNKCQQNVLVYSYDGFTGTSLLLLALGLFWGSDHAEEAALCLFRRPEVKFHLKAGDFVALKNLEPYLQWFKRQPVKDAKLVDTVPEDRIFRSYRPFTKLLDWFRAETEINFPAYIHENLLLGSASHASSVTLLAALKVTKVISLGEKPHWFSHLNCTFSHEATPDTTGPIVEPIYTCNNGRTCVYEVKITSPAMREQIFTNAAVPQLLSFIYVHGLEDDGRDSMYPFFVDCPEWVHNKLLVLPGENARTLVHCRIGVSRLASLVIASVMKHFQMSLVESYLYVRVRRFNVVIQPNLRLFYELFLYEAFLNETRYRDEAARSAPACWWTLCAEIHRLNQQYSM